MSSNCNHHNHESCNHNHNHAHHDHNHSSIHGHCHHNTSEQKFSNITIAFLLNFIFSIIEFFGGIYTGSTAILSDAIHDFSDSISLLLSYIAEKISTKKPNDIYTYGYKRITVIGAFVNIAVLSIGTFFVIVRAFNALLNPNELKTTEMIFLSILGILVNLISVVRLNGSTKILDKTVRLHLLEDLLGWISVLITSVIIHFTDFYILDPILSLAISAFVVYNISKRLVEVYKIIMHCVPNKNLYDNIKNDILNIEEISEIQNMHIWTLDGEENIATLSLLATTNNNELLTQTKNILNNYGITNSTVEILK